MKSIVLGFSIVVAALAASTVRAEFLLAAFGGDAIFKFDGVSSTLFASSPEMDGPTAMVFDGDGNLLVLNEFSHNVLKFDGATGAPLGTFIDSAALAAVDPSFDPGDMEMGADGNLYLMSHFNNPFGDMVGIRKFSAATGAYLGAFSAPRPGRHQHGLAFGLDGNWYQGNVDERSVEKFNGTTGAFEGTFAFETDMFPIADLALSSTSLYVAIHTGGLAHFDATTGAFLSYLEPTSGPGYWGILVDGGFLYASNLSAGTLRKYDALTGAFISSTPVGGGAFDILPFVVPEASGAAIMVSLAAIVFGCRDWRWMRRRRIL
jgi:DNA-binding beta-propeller fold protein YncE